MARISRLSFFLPDFKLWVPAVVAFCAREGTMLPPRFAMPAPLHCTYATPKQMTPTGAGFDIYGNGTTACTWLECELSMPDESTAVVT